MRGFLNETMHPLAGELSALIVACGNAMEHGDSDFYSSLEAFRKNIGWSDEKTADLYARVEDIDIDAPCYATNLSKALWENQRVYPG